jgi:hypothetical protein
MVTQVYHYKLKKKSGGIEIPADKITMERAAVLGAEVLMWTAQTVPRAALSPEGHFTPIALAKD